MRFRGLTQLLLLMLLALHAAGQSNEYLIENFTSSEGLPQNSVKSLALDENSFLWFTTEGGLVRYDGRNFKVYNHNNFPEIPGDRFQYLFCDYHGKLAATNNYGSLMVIENRQPKVVPNTSNKVYGFLHFAGSLPDYSRYYEVAYEQLMAVKEKWFSFPSYIFPLNSTDFIVLTRTGFLRYNNYQLKDSLSTTGLLPGNTFMIDSVIYFTDSTGAYYKFKPESNSYSRIHSLIQHRLYLPAPRTERFIWNFGTPHCYYKSDDNLYEISRSVNGDTLKAKRILSGLPGNCKITSVVYQKKTGTYYIGTDTKGLFIFRKKIVLNLPHDAKEITENDAYYAQVAIDSSHIFTTYGLIIGADTSYKTAPEVFNFESILRTKNNDLYYSNTDSIYRKSIDGKIFAYRESIGNALCYYDDGDTIFFGSTIGVGAIHGDSLTMLASLAGYLESQKPIQLLRDKDNTMWVATCSGLYYYSGDFKTKKNLPQLQNICVRSLFLWKDMLFIGTYGNGFYILADKKLIKMPVDDKNLMTHIHSFYIDARERLWMSSNNGLFVASVKEIVDHYYGRNKNIYYYLINKKEGINNPEFNGGCTPSVVKLENGYLSYPSLGGLVWINPDSVNLLLPEDKIFFENVRIDQAVTSSTNELKLAPDFKNFSLDIVVPYWGKRENLRIEYRLNRANSNWEKIEPEEKRLRFSNMPSGNYTLEVRVRNGFGKDDYFYNTLNFTVSEYFYEKTWVQLLGITCFLGLTLMGFRFYSANIIRKNELLERNINERTAELKESNELLHENLVKLQHSEEKLSSALTLRDKLMSIISHDLVTPIRYITISSRLARNEASTSPKEELVQVLEEIEATTMRLHDNAQNVLHWIRFQSQGMTAIKSNVAIHDLIDEVVSLYQPIAESVHTKIYNLSPEEDIIISDPRILKIVIQNIMNNAVKFTRAGAITITSETSLKDYKIRITDTGPGFSEAALENIRQIREKETGAFSSDFAEDGAHLGYQIIFELLRFLDGDFSITSTKDKGSTVEITLLNCLQEQL